MTWLKADAQLQTGHVNMCENIATTACKNHGKLQAKNTELAGAS